MQNFQPTFGSEPRYHAQEIHDAAVAAYHLQKRALKSDETIEEPGYCYPVP